MHAEMHIAKARKQSAMFVIFMLKLTDSEAFFNYRVLVVVSASLLALKPRLFFHYTSKTATKEG